MTSWACPTKFNFAVAAEPQGQASVGLAGSDSCPSCRPRAGPHRHHRPRVFGLTRVPLLICVVVVGSALPVMPLRTLAGAIAGGPGVQIRRVALFTDKVTVRSCGAGHREPALGRWPSRQGDRGQGRLARSPWRRTRMPIAEPVYICTIMVTAVLPARWAAVKSLSEIVVRNEPQVLPLGSVVVDSI